MSTLGKSSVPRELFRFRTWPATGTNRTREILESATFYCSSPREFDDPHDNLLGAHATGSPLDMDRFVNLDMAEIVQMMHKYKPGSITELDDSSPTVTDPKDRKTLACAARRQARRHSRVLCFSNDWAIELMWAFYADNHKGLCLYFDSRHDFFQNAKPVLYTHAPTDVTHLGTGSAGADQLAFCKSLPWQFQKEWRLLFPDDEPKTIPFPKEALKGVILGYRFPEPCFEDLKNTLLKSGYQLDIFQVQRIHNSYEFALIKRGTIGPAGPPKTASVKSP